MPSVKLTFSDRVLTYPESNGYVCFAKPNTYFGFSGINTQVKYYAQMTYPDNTTAELIVPTGSTEAVFSSVPIGTIVSGYISANAYYRTSLDNSELTDLASSRTTADPRKISFSGICDTSSHIGSVDTQQNNVVWTWTFNNNNRPNWVSNNGGMNRVYITPNTGRMSINSCYTAGSAYCCRLLADSNSGYWQGCTAKKNSPTKANIATTRIAATYNETWHNVYQSAHIALTGVGYHNPSYWNGTATNGGQRGLKAQYMINGNQVADPGKNVNNNFYSQSNGTNIATSFNLTGTGANMPATNWNNQAVYIYATIGYNTDNTAYYATKYPINQITACTATVKCSAIMP